MGESMKKFVTTGSVTQQPHIADNSTEQQDMDMDFVATGTENTADDRTAAAEAENEHHDGVLPQRVELNIPNVRGEQFGDFVDENFRDDDDHCGGSGDDNDEPECEIGTELPMHVCLRKVRERLWDETKQGQPVFCSIRKGTKQQVFVDG